MAKREVRAKRVKRIFPLPEAVPTGKGSANVTEAWKIRPERESPTGSPSTGIERGEMFVPLTDDDVARCVRAHEVAHVRWSPARPPVDLPQDIVQAVEDARIHTLLGMNGVDMSAGVHDPATLAAKLAPMLADPVANLRPLTLALTAVHGTGTDAVLREVVKQTHQAATGAACAALGEAWVHSTKAAKALTEVRKRPTFEDTRRVAAMLRDLLAAPDAEAAKDDAATARREADDAAAKEAARETKTRAHAAEEEDDAREERTGARVAAKGSGSGARWGTMTVHRPPLVQRLPPKWAIRKGRPAETGDLPKRYERYCVDMAVFTQRKRGRRGTVLVDMSGSMRLSAKQVLEILDAAPAARVAGYSGGGERGVLRIFAARGRRVADAHVSPPCVGGNVVDGPALQWLAKQKGPRIWVSDAGVTGVDDVPSSALTAEALRIKRMGAIVRVPQPEDAAVILRRHGKGGL